MCTPSAPSLRQTSQSEWLCESFRLLQNSDKALWCGSGLQICTEVSASPKGSLLSRQHHSQCLAYAKDCSAQPVVRVRIRFEEPSTQTPPPSTPSSALRIAVKNFSLTSVNATFSQPTPRPCQKCSATAHCLGAMETFNTHVRTIARADRRNR